MYSMLKRMRQDFNVYVGAETGVLKGLHLNQKAVINKNFNNLQSLERGHEITSMIWGNEEQNEIMMGLHNQTIRVFDVGIKAFTSSRELKVGEGPIVSLAKWNDVTISAVKSGQVTVWHGDGAKEINALKSGEFLSRMRQDPQSPNLIATGGKENDLQLWDLNIPDEPIFTAKNIKPDMLQLRVPVWVSDMTFLPEPNCIALATRHCHVRMYDHKRQRRPVVNFEWEESPLTCITPVADKSQVVVGTAHGRMGRFDLRMNKPEQPVGIYKSFAGAVRDLVVHPHLPLVFSVALDRFLRVHHLETGKLIHKEYLKSRLNRVLVRDDFEEGDLIPSTEKPKREWMKRRKVIEEELDYDPSEGGVEKLRKIEDDEVW
ncbi:WD repeat-containing protein 74-like [Penaeus japonicus]|uniref:WD repeat-containing protein 74-like n=1 Tax=Penaeus japonicus TaxID=27405 RepID=UPI001C717017|nr:WD repeat-containing protein 74-like [Penaeus japonicus]